MNYIGKTIYGYCNGFFGKDSYEDKIIIGCGYDWIVVKQMNNAYPYPEFCYFENQEQMKYYLEQWSIPTDYKD